MLASFRLILDLQIENKNEFLTRKQAKAALDKYIATVYSQFQNIPSVVKYHNSYTFTNCNVLCQLSIVKLHISITI